MSLISLARSGYRRVRSLSELPARARRAVAPWRTVRVRGLRVRLRCDTWITEWRRQTYGTKEPETLNWIDCHLKGGSTFFDIGANVGEFSIYAALRHPGVRVVAFEPEYANLHVLKDNLLANGLQDRVMVYSIAVGGRSGLSHLHIQDATPGAACHTESNVVALDLTRTRKPVIWREGIYTLTLDAFCQETGLSPHHLKIDVDGTELEILQGAARTLRSPALESLVVEISRRQVRDACAQLLQDAGWRLEWRDAGTSENEIWVRGSCAP